MGQSPPDNDTEVGQSTDTEDPKGQIAQPTDSKDDPTEQIASHRDRSQSIWLYFPHVELVFLLYSVQGALTTQLTVLRDGGGAMFYAAALMLVSIPLFTRRENEANNPNILGLSIILSVLSVSTIDESPTTSGRRWKPS